MEGLLFMIMILVPSVFVGYWVAYNKSETTEGSLLLTVFPIKKTLMVKNSAEDAFKAIVRQALMGDFFIDDLDVKNLRMVLSVKGSNPLNVVESSYLFRVSVRAGEKENAEKSVIEIGIASKLIKELKISSSNELIIKRFILGVEAAIHAYGDSNVNT